MGAEHCGPYELIFCSVIIDTTAKKVYDKINPTSKKERRGDTMPLQIIRQDITKMPVDAIVNTTNEEMSGYRGVDLAVHTVAGPELDAECANLPLLGFLCHRFLITRNKTCV